MIGLYERIALKRGLGLPSSAANLFPIRILKSFIKNTNSLNAIASLLLTLKFKSHFYFQILLSLVGKLVGNARIFIIIFKNCVFTFEYLILIYKFEPLVIVAIVFSELGNSEIKCYNFGRALSGCYLD